ncbi:Flp pilus assembly protein CpaB [Stenotrophomonas sp. PS02298]|uniref:Flp pilus assembly protein CpaB n=1 Tax=Stenotrophomonas sp. PS02298 TaxID=2991424 RepID=UPI00249C4F20|nr:Flp pilus assembly protein CpaB [Stenotrophomonas sp. PS02298]
MPKAIRIAAILLLAVAALLMVLAFGIGRRATAPTDVSSATPPTNPSKQMVVVASKDLPAGQPITGADLTITEMALPPANGYSAISAVEGRTPARNIAAGAMVTSEQLLQGIAIGIKPGERAVAVPVDELAGVSNRVAPGDYVDVFMSLQDPSSAGSGQNNTQARLLLSRLQVLGYGSADVGQASANTDEQNNEIGASPPEPGSRAETIASRDGRRDGSANADAAQARSAILAVPVQDAGRLLLAAHSGKLFLALRNPGDTGLADESIFATPAAVLALRGNLDESAAEAAARPENRAYAGIDLNALAGDNNRSPSANAVASAAPQRRRGARPASRQAIEIIRGTTPSNQQSSP